MRNLFAYCGNDGVDIRGLVEKGTILDGMLDIENDVEDTINGGSRFVHNVKELLGGSLGQG